MVLVAISVLLILGLYSYALAYQAPLRPMAQITGKPITIDRVTFQDETGEERDPAVFDRSTDLFVVVNVTLSYPSDSYFGTTLDFLQVIQIWEPALTPPGPFAFIGFSFGSISQGQEVASGVGWGIPEDAAVGDYTVMVQVWSKWFGQAGFVVYADPLTTTFTIT